MFSKEVQLEAVALYLQGVSPSEIRQKFGIKGQATILNWLTNIRMLGMDGLKDVNRSKTNYPYCFKMTIIRWRLEHKASFPVAARRFQLRNPSLIWQWERALTAGRLKPDNRRQKRTMTNQDGDKIKQLEEENDLLRIQVAYLEKLAALAQEKKKLQTKTKR